MIRRMMIFFVILATVLVLVHTSLLVVQSHQYAVLYRNNHITRIITQPGLYVKLPAFLQKVRLLDKRTLTSAGETAQHALTTSNQHTLMATWYVQWQITNPTEYAHQFGYRDTIIKQTLHETIRNSLQALIARNTATHWLSQGRADLDARLQQQVQHIAQQQKWGLRIQAIHIMRLDIPPAAAEQAQADMVRNIHTKQRQLQRDMQQELAQLQAQTKQAHAHIIEQAQGDAAAIRAQGDAAALAIYAKDHAKNPELAQYLQTLSLYQDSIKKQQDTLILNPSQDGLFSQLHNAPKNTGTGTDTSWSCTVLQAPQTGAGTDTTPAQGGD